MPLINQSGNAPVNPASTYRAHAYKNGTRKVAYSIEEKEALHADGWTDSPAKDCPAEPEPVKASEEVAKKAPATKAAKKKFAPLPKLKKKKS